MRFNDLRLVLAASLLSLFACARPDAGRAETLPHPDRPGASVEYLVRKPVGSGPWPTLVFLHGFQPPPTRLGGRAFVDWGVLDDYARKGFLAASVSLPGYGGSSGPADFAGPSTQHAVRAVISKLKTEKLAAKDHIILEGISLGAVTAALIATEDHDIAGLVLISGLYDLPSFMAHSKSVGAEQVKAALISETGGSEAALRSRSALLTHSRIRAATLIMNGALDDRTDPDQALRLAADIKAQGARAQARIYPELGHQIPDGIRRPEIDAFIETLTKEELRLTSLRETGPRSRASGSTSQSHANIQSWRDPVGATYSGCSKRGGSLDAFSAVTSHGGPFARSRAFRELR